MPGQPPFVIWPHGPFEFPPSSGYGYVTIIKSDKDTTFFDPNTPARFPDSTGTKFIRQVIFTEHDYFSGGEVNDRGHLMLYSGDKWWDGQALTSTGLPKNTPFWGLTNEDRMLGQIRHEQASKESFLWENGARRTFEQILVGTAWEGQWTDIVPLLISNEDPVHHSYNIVTSLKDAGKDKLVVWTNLELLPPSGIQPALRVWRWSEMRLPENVHVEWENLEVINSSGVIAAIGNAGTGDNHALLLLPLTLTNIADPTIRNGAFGTDKAIQFRQSDVDTNINCVAWITGNDPASSYGPRMPQL